ncbi:MAG: hypothetical protein HY700_11235 [Gemmatimonadetes bacterium]|nr:hypothetical protein [Gemmatimonadota bacterium]
MLVRYLTLVLSLGSLPRLLPGQEIPTTAEAQVNRQAVQGTVGDPTAPSTSIVSPALIASVTSADKMAIGSLGTTLGRNSGGELNLWLRGSGPLDQSDNTVPVILGDLQGVRSATRLAAGLTVTRWRWDIDVKGQRAVCRRVFGDPELAPDSITKLLKEAVRAAPEGRTQVVRDSVLDYMVGKRCSKHRLPAAYRRAFDDQVDYGRIWLLAAHAEYGRQTYRYADTLALSYAKTTERVNAFDVGAGMYQPAWRLLLAGHVRLERGFSEGTPRQYCIPTGPSPGLQCRTVALAPPSLQNVALGTLELRWFANAHWGLSPRLTCDFSGERGLGFELPILVRQDTDKGFTSAFILGARSKSSDPSIDDRLYVALRLGVAYGVGL